MKTTKIKIEVVDGPEPSYISVVQIREPSVQIYGEPFFDLDSAEKWLRGQMDGSRETKCRFSVMKINPETSKYEDVMVFAELQ